MIPLTIILILTMLALLSRLYRDLKRAQRDQSHWLSYVHAVGSEKEALQNIGVMRADRELRERLAAMDAETDRLMRIGFKAYAEQLAGNVVEFKRRERK